MIGRRARRVNLEILIAGRLRWLLLSEEASVVVARHRNSLSVSIVPNLCPTRAHSSAFGHTSNAFLTDTAFTPDSSQAAHSDPCRLGGRPVRLRRIGLVVTLALGVLAAPLAAKRATNTIPIVMTNAGDPVGSGLVTSLGRPGGNVTGLSLLAPAVVGKQLELLKEVVPKVTRMAVLTNPGYPSSALTLTEAEAAMRPLGLQLQVLDARGPGEFEAAFSAMTRERAGALLILADPIFFGERKRLADLAARSRLPAVSGLREFADAGILMAYGASLSDLFRRAATYVVKILKGRKPADLPVEQPTKFELVINLKTAKALGLTIPQSVLLRAAHVIP